MRSAAIITVNFHSAHLIRRLESLLAGQVDIALYVADNSGEFSPISPATTVVNTGGNIGFGRACNRAVEACNADVLLFLNPDTQTDLKSLKQLTLDMGSQRNMIWGPVIDDGSGWTSALLRRNGFIVPFHRVEYPIGCEAKFRSIYVSGACMGIHRELFVRLGGFRDDIFMYAEDVDLCVRAAEKGVAISILDHVKIVHLGGRSSSKRGARFLRLIRSIRGHYAFLSGRYSWVQALVGAVILASGRRRVVHTYEP